MRRIRVGRLKTKEDTEDRDYTPAIDVIRLDTFTTLNPEEIQKPKRILTDGMDEIVNPVMKQFQCMSLIDKSTELGVLREMKVDNNVKQIFNKNPSDGIPESEVLTILDNLTTRKFELERQRVDRRIAINEYMKKKVMDLDRYSWKERHFSSRTNTEEDKQQEIAMLIGGGKKRVPEEDLKEIATAIRGLKKRHQILKCSKRDELLMRLKHYGEVEKE